MSKSVLKLFYWQDENKTLQNEEQNDTKVINLNSC